MSLKMIDHQISQLLAKIPSYPRKRVANLAKRGFDIIAASVLLLLSLPLMILTAAAIALNGGSLFYYSDRVGANGISFKCIKFQTMIPDADHCLDEYLVHHPRARDQWLQDRKLAFDPRVTSVGRLLRQSSLDELPQLINVIRGEMSLVGPRPVTRSELDLYYCSGAELYKSMRPGITGLWQVSGRNDVSYATRVALDERYVREWNFILDILILCRTPRVVLSKRGAR
jgi:exopolysaccharide production protein ExoY